MQWHLYWIIDNQNKLTIWMLWQQCPISSKTSKLHSLTCTHARTYARALTYVRMHACMTVRTLIHVYTTHEKVEFSMPVTTNANVQTVDEALDVFARQGVVEARRGAVQPREPVLHLGHRHVQQVRHVHELPSSCTQIGFDLNNKFWRPSWRPSWILSSC